MKELSVYEKAVFDGNEDLKALIAVHGSVLLPENGQQLEGGGDVEVVARDGRRATVKAATVSKIAPSKDGEMLVGLFIDTNGGQSFQEELTTLREDLAKFKEEHGAATAWITVKLVQLEKDLLALASENAELKAAAEPPKVEAAAEPPKVEAAAEPPKVEAAAKDTPVEAAAEATATTTTQTRPPKPPKA